MEQKTKINAEDGKQELVITREFDLPVELLFKAYAEPGIVEQCNLQFCFDKKVFLDYQNMGKE